MKQHRIIELLGLLLVFVLIVSGCAIGHASATATAPREKIVFWHEMTGPAADQLKKFATQFNASQKKYQIVPEFEGTYNEAVQKILQTHGTSASPAIFQSMDVSTSELYHAKVATPMQHFIDKDHYNMNQIAAVPRAFYSQGGKQISMPFNTSQPVLYYNASLLKRLGIKAPAKDPSYSDITAVAKQIQAKSKGKVNGMTVEEYGWLFEQFMANSNEHMANNENGRQGVPTAVNFDQPGAKKAMQWIQTNVKNKDIINFGSGSTAETNEMAAFLAGKLGIFMQSSADIGNLTSGMKDKLGICYFPHADGQKANGVSIGGASLWIGNDKSKSVQQGAWEFTKFLVNAKNQAIWEKVTGYMAINRQATKEPILKSLFAKQPMVAVPGEQLARTKPNTANSGIFMEDVVQERTLTQTAMQQVYNNGNIDKALKTATDSMNAAIKNNNKASGLTK